MSMRLSSGEFASNAKENMSVFGAHFTNVLNNHRPVDYSVLNLLKQKPHMTSIDNPITFSEVKRAINKLKKGKSPGLNGIPPKALKVMYTTSAISLKGSLTMKAGIQAMYHCDKER